MDRNPSLFPKSSGTDASPRGDVESCSTGTCSTGVCSPCLYIWGGLALFLVVQLILEKLL
ncbi:MAG: hypothetical protein R3B90_01220 [Planctomycetaceae bacterium]